MSSYTLIWLSGAQWKAGTEWEELVVTVTSLDNAKKKKDGLFASRFGLRKSGHCVETRSKMK